MLLWLDRKSARLVTTSIINTKSTRVPYQMELFLDNLDFLLKRCNPIQNHMTIRDHKNSLNTSDIKAKLYTRKLHTWKAWAGSMQGETRLNIPIWYYILYDTVFFILLCIIPILFIQIKVQNDLNQKISLSLLQFLDHRILQTDANRNHKCHNFDEYRLKAVSSGILSDWVYLSWNWKWLWASEESLNRSDRCIQYFKYNL